MLLINEKKFDTLWAYLKYIYGFVALLVGIDKFFYFITDWNMFVGAWVFNLPPVIATNIIPIVGVIEIAAGLILLTKWPRFGAYLVAAWLGVIILNLCTISGMRDIIIRDIVIAVGYITFALLTELKETAVKQ